MKPFKEWWNKEEDEACVWDWLSAAGLVVLGMLLGAYFF